MPQDFVHQSQAEHNEKAANLRQKCLPRLGGYDMLLCGYTLGFQVTERGLYGIS